MNLYLDIKFKQQDCIQRIECNNLKNCIDFNNHETTTTSPLYYYNFGSVMPGRNGNNGDYRYGFNGMEKDDEITGITGSHLDFNARIYDSRLGRFLSLDPLAREYPSQSDYAAFNNNPIIYVDPTGKGGELVITGENTAVLKINIVLYSDVVSETELQALKSATLDYAENNLSKGFILNTKEGPLRGQYAKSLNVNLEISVEVRSFDEVTGEKGLANTNESVANNFIYVNNIETENGGYQEGNAGFVSRTATEDVVLHEALGSLLIYKSGEKGPSGGELHGHNPNDKEKSTSILHGSFTKGVGAGLTNSDVKAFNKSNIVTPTGTNPTPIGEKTNQTYSNNSQKIIDRRNGTSDEKMD